MEQKQQKLLLIPRIILIFYIYSFDFECKNYLSLLAV